MKIRVRDLRESAVFAILILAATLSGALCPIGDGAYLHIGDALIYTSVLFLPTPFAIVAAAMGACIADAVLGSAVYIPATIVTKALMVLAAKGIMRLAKTELSQESFICRCGVVNIIGYFFFECFMFSVSSAVSGIMFNLLQMLASAVVFVIIAAPARKIYKRVNKTDDK